MTRRRELEHRRNSLGEIREIMNSMKTLAYLETRKLSRSLAAQRGMTGHIELVAQDFLAWHAGALPEAEETLPVYVIIGTERGFCGDFNHKLLAQLDTIRASGTPTLLSVGHKLSMLLEQDRRVSSYIDGANVMEEIFPVLARLVEALGSLQARFGALDLHVLYHCAEGGTIAQKLLPPFQQFLDRAPRHGSPPQLNIPPRTFLAELVDHYLLAALYGIMYESLMAENQFRVRHLQGALDHIDEQSESLARRCNALRQEEIIEEIEVILLSEPGPGVA